MSTLPGKCMCSKRADDKKKRPGCLLAPSRHPHRLLQHPAASSQRKHGDCPNLDPWPMCVVVGTSKAPAAPAPAKRPNVECKLRMQGQQLGPHRQPRCVALVSVRARVCHVTLDALASLVHGSIELSLSALCHCFVFGRSNAQRHGQIIDAQHLDKGSAGLLPLRSGEVERFQPPFTIWGSLNAEPKEEERATSVDH